MKIGSFLHNNEHAWGTVHQDHVKVLGKEGTVFPNICSVFLGSDFEKSISNIITIEEIDINFIRWLPTIPNSKKIFCVGLNYEDHRKETGREIVKYPTIFTRFADSQIGHEEPLLCPFESEQFDFEGELAVIIGRGGRNIPQDIALDHVAGYSCYNDATVRDWQNHSIQFIPGKNWPATGSFGPWMVTRSSYGSLGPQRIQTRLNNTVMQDANFHEMIFSVPQIIAYCSTFTPLSAGDLIISGTPGGVGAKRTPPVWMKSGDIVEVDIEGIGILRNEIRKVSDRSECH